MFVAWMDRVFPRGLIQPVDKRCEYDAADLANHPCNRPDLNASRFFHLDVWQDGASTVPSVDHYNDDRIRT
jgi:hypothetical protein